MGLNRERVLELLELLKSSTAAELSVKEGGTTIRLARHLAPELVETAAEEIAAFANLPGEAQPVSVAGENTVTVTSRVVGLFYRGKTPGEQPLVELGAQVKEGQPLGIVEVLRKPTEIISPAAGEVVAILADEGAGIQYGDPLFVIRTDAS